MAIFASYDKFNQIPEYVIYYLKELKKVADIVFVSDNELPTEELDKIKPLTVHQICQKHGEYDFGSYKRGYLYALDNNLLNKYDDLILCNDSCFGPFYPLADIITKMNDKKCDFWGMFKQLHQESTKEHIQSYFIYLKKTVVTSKVFDDFMKGITHQKNKKDIIHKYEIGLSQALIQAGYNCEGLFSSTSNMPHNNHALKLITEQFPFLKKSLFSYKSFYRNAYCRQIYKWKDVITQVRPDYPVECVEKYLIKQLGAKEYHSYLNGLHYYLLWDWKRFLFQKKITKKGKLIIKVCKIPIYRCSTPK